MLKVRRALISVSDKTGVVEFAKGLAVMGVEILSTGGTARLLADAGLFVKEVAEHTGFPEILDGRVKTLHPSVHGGILAVRDNPAHMKQLEEHHIPPIDLVAVNLYPFEKVSRKKNVTLEEAIENIDIGGPTMIRSAAKNFRHVAVVCNPKRYKEVLQELEINSGLLPDSVLMNLATEAFGHTARYDGIIYAFLEGRRKGAALTGCPREITLSLEKVQDLRYGENPHQPAAFYARPDERAGLSGVRQLHGKELSFNNILDLDAALAVVAEFSGPAAVIIKHNNPTGVAEDDTLVKAYAQAWKTDPLSAFGGIIGLNRKVDAGTAGLISKSGFMECVIAPGFDREALKVLTKKRNVRLLQLRFGFRPERYDVRQVTGGFLVQGTDDRRLRRDELRTVTRKKPTPAQTESLLFGWSVVKHVRSNAIILVKGRRTVGIGCGQTSRIEAVGLAIKKAGKQARGAFLVSDAFIPKTDNVQAAAKAGIKAIIQTGGSVADEDVIRAADRAGIAMVFTGVRHFRH